MGPSSLKSVALRYVHVVQLHLPTIPAFENVRPALEAASRRCLYAGSHKSRTLPSIHAQHRLDANPTFLRQRRLTVDWHFDGDVLVFTWVEDGGPPVAVPTRSGFGSRMIERTLSASLAGPARIEYQPEGIRFELRTNRKNLDNPAG